jgi:hypothetical protein
MPKHFLSAPPVYIIVGLYRTIHDPNIRVPVWVRTNVINTMKPGPTMRWLQDKLRRGLTRGLIVASIYVITCSFAPLCIYLFEVAHPCQGRIDFPLPTMSHLSVLFKVHPRCFALFRDSLALGHPC